MIDLILIIFMLCVFYAGFWCGNRYKSLGELFSGVKRWLHDKFK